MKMTKYRYIFILVAIILVILVQIFALLSGERYVIEDYLNKVKTDTVKLMNVSIGNKSKVATLLYDITVTEDIKALMASAYHSDEKVRDTLRELLLKRLEKDYKLMKKTGIEQFQFHFPDSTSFLRFHQPDIYGDHLSDIRVTVNRVIKNQEEVSAYEEGRFFGGYRYVYPIHYEDEYVGSVEFSYKYQSVISPVNQSFGTVNYLLIDENEVKRKTHDLAETGYVLDPLTSYGYVRVSEMERNLVEELNVKQELFNQLNIKVAKALQSSITEPRVEYYGDRQQMIVAKIIPLHDVTDRIIGYMIFYKKDDNFLVLQKNYTDSIRTSLLLTIVSVILLLTSFLSYNQVRKKALYDSLTGLYTRHAYTGMLRNEINQGICMMLDIDDFKAINDKYGHFKGDEILKAIASMVKHHIREKDCAIRWGGEEFLILLQGIDKDVGIERAKSLVDKIGKMDIQGIHVTVSIGVALLTEERQGDFDNADKALYKAKADGKNRVCVYDEESM